MIVIVMSAPFPSASAPACSDADKTFGAHYTMLMPKAVPPAKARRPPGKNDQTEGPKDVSTTDSQGWTQMEETQKKKKTSQPRIAPITRIKEETEPQRHQGTKRIIF
jgi:hypothetical protein